MSTSARDLVIGAVACAVLVYPFARRYATHSPLSALRTATAAAAAADRTLEKPVSNATLLAEVRAALHS